MTPEQWIQQAWDRFPLVANPNQRAYQAWQYLKQLRDTGNSEDLNLAYAEHFMYARNAVGLTGDFWGEMVNTFGWEGMKAIGFATGNQDVSKTGDKPPSPPTWEAIGHAWAGSWQGQVDFAEKQQGWHGWQFIPIGPAIWLDRVLIMQKIDQLTGKILKLTKDIGKNFTSQAVNSAAAVCLAQPTAPGAEMSVSAKVVSPSG